MPRAAASSGSTSSHLRQGGPQGSGSTANVPGSMSTGSWIPFPYFWWAWTGNSTWDSGTVRPAPHPAHTKTNKCPPRKETGGIVAAARRATKLFSRPPRG
ncbi:hypothetical protein Slala02_65450 [Streptomyces lavendulae subsp. lavendulae]|nr:hypothetical protein Slala01_69060 [Streptomyces lavendulae subsp. lavendulae]GLX30725.1 hypothetical protein Slala02_65450 [Streptomyces lavendulae subsp. lavendulae]